MCQVKVGGEERLLVGGSVVEEKRVVGRKDCLCRTSGGDVG
jgi:hypothetical protein